MSSVVTVMRALRTVKVAVTIGTTSFDLNVRDYPGAEGPHVQLPACAWTLDQLAYIAAELSPAFKLWTENFG